MQGLEEKNQTLEGKNEQMNNYFQNAKEKLTAVDGVVRELRGKNG